MLYAYMIYIYIYIERERDRQNNVYIYIYIYRERERGAAVEKALEGTTGPKERGVVSNNWLGCVLLSILYTFKPSC